MDRRILKLPKLVRVWSANEFGELQNSLRTLTEHNLIKVREVGFDNRGSGRFVGVVYLFKKPSKAEIRKLAKAQKIKLEDDYA